MNKLDQLARGAHRSGLLRATSWLGRRRTARHLGAFGYHRLAERRPDEPWSDEIIDATPSEFRRFLGFVQRHGHSVALDSVLALSGGKPLNGTPILITFDDGYRSCVDVALPLLQEFGMRATFFLPTAFIDERRLFWWDRLAYMLKHTRTARLALGSPWNLDLDLHDSQRATAEISQILEHQRGLDQEGFLDALAEALDIPWSRETEARYADELMLTWKDARRLVEAGMDVQSHTVSHRILQTLSPHELEFELVQSRARLEQRLGEEIHTIAYPSGYPIRDDPDIVSAATRAGYRLGCTYGGGSAPTRGFDPFNVKRIAIDRRSSSAMLALQVAWPSWSHEGARARAYPRPPAAP